MGRAFRWWARSQGIFLVQNQDRSAQEITHTLKEIDEQLLKLGVRAEQQAFAKRPERYLP